MTSEIDLAYMAGVLDSDGSISIGIDRWRVEKLGHNPAFFEIVCVGQCDTQAIELFKKTFGGNVRSQEAKSNKRRGFHLWTLRDSKASLAVMALLPYMRIKRRQAEIILRLREIKDRGREANTYREETTTVRKTRWGERRYHKRFLRPDVLDELNSLASEIRSLNDTRFGTISYGLCNGDTVEVISRRFGKQK